MADWNLPLLTSLYQDFMALLKARDEDCVTLGKNGYTNGIVGTVRYERATNTFQEWNGSAWVNLVISLASGGLGSNTPTGGRGTLGIGTMGVQNANNVAITGGSILGLNSLAVNGHASVGSLESFGTSTLHGQVYSNNISVNQNLNAGALSVIGAATIGSLGVSGHMTSNTLAVTYDITAGRNVNFAGNTWTGSLTVGAAAAISGNLSAGSLNISGTTVLSGTVNTGSLTATGNIAATGAIVANMHLHGITGIYCGNPAQLLTVGNGLLDSTKISGLIPTYNLGAGAANAGTYLRGDGTWQVVSMSPIKSVQHISHNIVVPGNVEAQEIYNIPLQIAVNPAKCFVIGRTWNNLIYLNLGPGGAVYRWFTIESTYVHLVYMRNTSGDPSTLAFNFTLVEYV